MFRNYLATFAVASLSLVSACTDSTVTEDELAGDVSEELAGKADLAGSDTFTYFHIRADVRKCASPGCGGYFVSRVNSAKLTCADGRRAQSCYVASLDTSALGLSDRDLAPMRDNAYRQGGVLVRGAIKTQRFPGYGNLGRFDATEAWVAGAADGAVDGIGVKVEQSGVRCIQAPCPDKREAKLNGSVSAQIADLDFAPSGATEDEIGRGLAGLTFEGGGLIVFGDRYTVRANGQTAKGRTVTQFYTRVQAAVDECFVGGCSGQVCSDRDGVITTCDFRDEYVCYQSATCERQADGACGWSATPELAACLANPPAPAISVAECEALGGQVRGDIGDGQIQCAAGERELGRVSVGIEGGVCCAAS